MKPLSFPRFAKPAALPGLVAALLGSSALVQAGEIPIEAELHIISSNTGPTHPSTGININTFLGADRFYNAGYTGTRTIQANIEAQHIGSTHETLTHVAQFVTGTGALGTVGTHATEVGQAMGGRPAGDTLRSGIAPNATLWSGAIATSVSGGSFNMTIGSLASTYSTILKTGVSGQTADVFNSSWGYTEPTGKFAETVGIDGLLYQTGKVGVISAGNDGPGSNTVSSPGAGYNSIVVAALRSDGDTNPYNTVSSFSSRGPNSYYHPPTNQTFTGLRSRVDIAAPGQNLTLAVPNASNTYASNQAGTSFAAPIVAGGASLLVDAGKDIYAANSDAIDGRVIKAVLLNSADKTQDWNNGQALSSGVITTTQSLDYAVGAGRMNLNKAFDQYVDTAHGGQAGTTDVTGHDCLASGGCDMGLVATTGWDYGWANQGSTNNYFIDTQLSGGKIFTATLDWFVEQNSGSDADFSSASFGHFADLDLVIFQYDPLNHAIMNTIAQSISDVNTVEHLSFLLPSDGYYGVRVSNIGDWYNYTGATGELFGLAWSVVPEPTTFSLLLIGAAGGTFRTRKRS